MLAEVRTGNAKTDEVHDQLNSAKRVADQRDEQLRTALTDANIAVPPDPNLAPTDAEKEARNAL